MIKPTRKLEILELFNSGMKQADIARQLGVSRQRVNAAINNTGGYNALRSWDRAKVAERASYTCENCRAPTHIELGNAHHLTRLGTWAEVRSLLNLVWLCRNCHVIIHQEQRRCLLD